MFARYTSADVNVIGLIGERGREVQEFIEGDLGPEGLARSVVVVATSDETALMRRQAAYLTLALAEHFRDRDKDVLCLIDSITRFAMAQREIGLSAGEPPTTKGFTRPSSANCPGCSSGPGPASDGARSPASSPFWSRATITTNRSRMRCAAFSTATSCSTAPSLSAVVCPAINVLRSISRSMPHCNGAAENRLVQRAKSLMATYEDMAEMIRLGAYRAGSDAAVDEAVHYHDALEAVLVQDRNERCDLAAGYEMLAACLGGPSS